MNGKKVVFKYREKELVGVIRDKVRTSDQHGQIDAYIIELLQTGELIHIATTSVKRIMHE